jgi:hypothetical protein
MLSSGTVKILLFLLVTNIAFSFILYLALPVLTGGEFDLVSFPSVPTAPTLPDLSGDWWEILTSIWALLTTSFVWIGETIIYVFAIVTLPAIISYSLIPAPLNLLLTGLLSALYAVIFVPLAIALFPTINSAIRTIIEAIKAIVPW